MKFFKSVSHNHRFLFEATLFWTYKIRSGSSYWKNVAADGVRLTGGWRLVDRTPMGLLTYAHFPLLFPGPFCVVPGRTLLPSWYYANINNVLRFSTPEYLSVAKRNGHKHFPNMNYTWEDTWNCWDWEMKTTSRPACNLILLMHSTQTSNLQVLLLPERSKSHRHP